MISLRTLFKQNYLVRERIHGMRNISRVQFHTGYGSGNDGPTPKLENKPDSDPDAQYKKKINSGGSQVEMDFAMNANLPLGHQDHKDFTGEWQGTAGT